MSTPQERIQDDLKAALKAGEKKRLSTLRMLLSEMKNERIKHGEELDDEGFYAVVRRAVKQRKDSVEQYTQGGREDLAATEREEIGILSDYLPRQVGEDDLRSAIRDFVAAEGLSGPRGIGPVMKAMIARFGATADSATINRLAREILAG